MKLVLKSIGLLVVVALAGILIARSHSGRNMMARRYVPLSPSASPWLVGGCSDGQILPSLNSHPKKAAPMHKKCKPGFGSTD